MGQKPKTLNVSLGCFVSYDLNNFEPLKDKNLFTLSTLTEAAPSMGCKRNTWWQLGNQNEWSLQRTEQPRGN